MTDVTHILAQIHDGNTAAADELLPLVYDELRKLASARLSNERADHTLQATALVHEAFIRLIDRREVEPRDFESVKAQMIKQLKKTRGSMFRSEIMAPIRAEGEALLVDIDQEAIANEMLERLLGQR